jgi:ATP-dependent Clp protease ATP-binding subunit ClpB
VLFDEIEKAHADVFNAMLQILDDGRLTDGQGRTVDFKNTVIIMTSNVGTEFLNGSSSTFDAKVREAVLDSLRSRFRPEFLNRIDEIVLFRPLAREQLKSIVDIQMEQVRRRMAERKIGIELTDAARELLVEEGYDAVYGARPLKRTIQRLILDPLALQVLEGKFLEGDTVVVNAEKGAIVLYKEENRTKKKAA